MKKSELRKLIREGIKELIKEQETNYSGKDGRSGLSLTPPKVITKGDDDTTPELKEQQTCNGAYLVLEACPGSPHWTGTYIPGPWHGQCVTINGAMPTQADVGTIIDHGSMNGSFGPNNYKVLQVNPGIPGSWPGTMYTTPYCCADGCPSSCPTCDPSAWPNQATWTANWTSLGPFNSTNPNQPCNYICNKIQDWENTCQNAGPNWQNQLACKIAEAQNQAQIHNCSC